MIIAIILVVLYTFIPKPDVTMKITSSSFKEGEMIPQQYTCDGANISPPLSWSNAPGNTKTFAIICDDPDAPGGTWVHWVIYNIPASEVELREHIPPIGHLPNGTKQGINDFRKTGYGGPCPPRGTHRYYFRLFALSVELSEDQGLTKLTLLKTMQGNILAEAQLMGRYQR